MIVAAEGGGGSSSTLISSSRRRRGGGGVWGEGGWAVAVAVAAGVATERITTSMGMKWHSQGRSNNESRSSRSL